MQPLGISRKLKDAISIVPGKDILMRNENVTSEKHKTKIGLKIFYMQSDGYWEIEQCLITKFLRMGYTSNFECLLLTLHGTLFKTVFVFIGNYILISDPNFYARSTRKRNCVLPFPRESQGSHDGLFLFCLLFVINSPQTTIPISESCMKLPMKTFYAQIKEFSFKNLDL